jgi:4-hydroxybenzoate polyprenyltransferase
MTKNPLYNALLAIAYIAALVSAVFYGSKHLEGLEETIFLPMGFLATFVLSAALMGYLFFYQPIILLLDGQREKAAKLFLHTVAIFALLTALVIITALVVGVSPGVSTFFLN